MADLRPAPDAPWSSEHEVVPTPTRQTGPLSVSDGRRVVAPSAPTARGFGTLLRNKLFLRLWMAQLISQTIMNAANYAMIVLVTKESNSSFATSGAIVAFSLPALIFGAPAGALVDRFDRRLVLWVSNVLRALATVVFILALIFAPRAVWPVYALTFFIAMVGQFFTPAEGAAIPRLVHRQELMNALALFNVTFTLAQAAGLIIIGPLALLLIPQMRLGGTHYGLTLTPIMSLFVIITLLYLVCAGLIVSIPKRVMRTSEPQIMVRNGVRQRRDDLSLKAIWADIMESWAVIRADTALHISVWQLTIAGIVVSIVAMIAPRFVQLYFHKPAELAAMVFVPAGIGLVVGSVATPNIVRRFKYARTVTAGIIFLAGSMAFLVIGYTTAPYIYGKDWWNAWPYLIGMLALTFLIGIGLDLINVPAQTMMQERSPDWVKGRVLAVQIMLLNAITVVFVPAVGWIADHLGLSNALLVVAGMVALAGLLSIVLMARTGATNAELASERRGSPEGNA